MTRKHIEAIARSFRAGMPRHNFDAVRGYKWAIRDVAEALKTVNPRFDAVRFLKDCGE